MFLTSPGVLLVFIGAATGRTTHLIIGTQMEDGRPVETSGKFLQARRAGMRIVKEDDIFQLIAKPATQTPRKRSRRESSSSIRRQPSGDGSPASPSPLHAAAVRAAGGFPLSMFPERLVGAAKRRKLELLAGHLVTITEKVLSDASTHAFHRCL